MLTQRPRRNRQNAAIRGLVRETRLSADRLILPVFLVDGKNKHNPIKSLPGVAQLSTDHVLKEIETSINLGIRSFVIFPAVEDKLKDHKASYSYSPKNFYLKAAREIKKRFPEVCLISDVAMDPYSSDGHDGLVENGQIVIRLLQRAAKQHNAAVICVTHDPRLESFADRIIHIEDGRILDDRRVDAPASSDPTEPSLIGA